MQEPRRHLSLSQPGLRITIVYLSASQAQAAPEGGEKATHPAPPRTVARGGARQSQTECGALG